MRSKASNTNNPLHWRSSIERLLGKRSQNTILKLQEAGLFLIEDLLWKIPLRIQSYPEIQPFHQMQAQELFIGKGRLINLSMRPSYGRFGKGRVSLFNCDVLIQDQLSEETLNLKWFNAYPNLKKNLEAKDEIIFRGTPTEFRGSFQIVNPKLGLPENKNNLLIEYPTINGITGNKFQKIIEKIPAELWKEEIISGAQSLGKEYDLTLLESFRILHGIDKRGMSLIEQAKERLIYEEFFLDQVKVHIRRSKIKQQRACVLEISDKKLEDFKNLFPYDLTPDQINVLQEIRGDLISGHPMMRILQGDVGCGKTTIAIIASLIARENHKQTAIMAPTESLARQHFLTFSNTLKDHSLRIALLLGSTKSKEKKLILENLAKGEIDLIIGTHSLIQDSVVFDKLALCIIDEQHKFGVEQRLKLASKGEAPHGLIMSATPIPRTLQLAQYGDLDVSTIKSIPPGRKGTKTRIIGAEFYSKFLSFIKTRLDLGEQVYIVAPAIEESEALSLRNVNEIEGEFKKYFPNYSISTLHGQLKNEEKAQALENFSQGATQILISTTVIEVGINVPNATVMSIYNPDRFGLSSLHQLRGRVGRGKLPGFFFLILPERPSAQAVARLKILEQTTDGFKVASADLENRGEGDLFGVNQSGTLNTKKLANLFEHFPLFEKAHADFQLLEEKHLDNLLPMIEQLSRDKKISITL